MNREETEAAIEVMQAWLDGAEIEERQADGGGWGEWSDRPLTEEGWYFNCENENRIKPKPREFWINLYREEGHSHTVWNSEGKARKYADTHVKRTIKVREVL